MCRVFLSQLVRSFGWIIRSSCLSANFAIVMLVFLARRFAYFLVDYAGLGENKFVGNHGEYFRAFLAVGLICFQSCDQDVGVKG